MDRIEIVPLEELKTTQHFQDTNIPTDYIHELEFEIHNAIDEMLPTKKLSAGRPKKQDKDKVQKKTIYLTPEEMEFLNQLPFGRGVGTKIKKIIHEYKKHINEKQIEVKV